MPRRHVSLHRPTSASAPKKATEKRTWTTLTANEDVKERIVVSNSRSKAVYSQSRGEYEESDDK